MKTLKEAKKRIEALEQKVRELEMRPIHQVHYYYQQPLYGPHWQYVPQYPSITWGGGSATNIGAGAGPSGYAMGTSGDGTQWSYQS